MKKRVLLIAALVAISTVGTENANAVGVSNWSELNTNRAEANIEFSNDITAEGTPGVITFTTAADQVINGNGHSLIGTDGSHSISIQNTANLTFSDWGKYSEGSADASSFMYTDLNNSAKYVSVDDSVNSFTSYFVSNWKPITLAVNNSVFANNGADRNARLFVLYSGQTFNVKDSIFYNNKTANNEAIIGGGKANINIENSIFYNNNNLTSQGGVITNTGTVSIKNSYFVNNHADDDWDGFGGVIQLSTGSTGSTIEGSRFEGNTAYYDGGAIALEAGMSGISGVYVKHIKDSQFINNASWHDSDEYGYDGGAIATDGGFIETIDNVVFDGNKAGWHGGGLWLGMSESYDEYGHIQITNSTFENNEAGLGGGLYIEYGVTDGNKHAYITNTEFTDNTVTNVKHYTSSNFGSNSRPGGYPAGGALVVGTTSRQGLPFSLPTTLNNVTFSGNTAVPHTTKNYSAGGAMYFVGITADNPLKIVDSTFSKNSAFEGGALFVDNADTAIIAQTKDVIFSENTAGADSEDYNGGADIYFQANEYAATLSLNAAEGKKIVFNGSIAAYEANGKTATININNSGVTYNTYDGETETSNDAGTAGEIQFNARVGDETQSFSAINLYGGKLSIGQNEDNNANTDNPDGYINDNNFNVLGDSTLNTVNGIIGEFAPKAFVIANGVTLDYQMDVDLVNKKSDTLNVSAQDGSIENNGTLSLAAFNIFSDSEEQNLKIKYSDTNVNGSLKDGYTIMTSTQTYDVSTLNDDTGSYVIFSQTQALGGLPAAIYNQADQYTITNGEDEKITAWAPDEGNVIKSDIDINGNGKSIYTEDDLDGMVVSQGTSVVLRNIDELSGFNNALTNEGGTLTLTDTSVADNTGDADITNNGGTVTINANTKDVTIGSGDDTDNAIVTDGGTVSIKGENDHKVTVDGTVEASNSATLNVNNTTFNDDVTVSGTSTLNVGASTAFDGDITVSGGSTVNINAAPTFGDDTDLTVSDSASTVNIDAADKTTLSATTSNNGTINTKSNTDIKGNISGGGVIENTASNLNVLAEVQQSAFTNTSGTVVVDDENGSITTSGKISNAGTITANANNIAAENGISNTGTLNLTGGETQSSISGNGGTTYIKGDDVTVSNTITGNTISVETGGVANLLKSADISGASKFVAHGGDLNLQKESSTDTFNLGNVDLQSNMGLAIDVDLSPAGEMNKLADNITATAVTGNSLILINNLNITNDSSDYIPSYAKVADNVLKNNVNIGDSTRVKVDQLSPVQGENDSFIVTYVVDAAGSNTGGFLKFEYCDLYNAVKSTTENKAYVMTGDEEVSQDLGILYGNTLTISGNNNKITGQGSTEGISVAEGESQTLSVYDVSEYSGFDTAIANADNGTVNIENVTFTGNGTDIDNNGTLNFKGTDVVDTVTGDGDTVISTYTDEEGNKVKADVTINDSLEQGSLTLSTEDDKLTNKGAVSVDELTNAGTVDNKGTLTVKGGENNGTISNDSGEMIIDGEFTNNSKISQKSVTVSDNTTEEKPFTNNGEVTADNFTNNGYTDNGDNGTISADTISNEGTLITDASNIISTNGKPVTNNGELEFTSGTNNNDIEGEGETVVSGDVENVANINNDVTVNSDGTLNNNGGSLGGAGKTVTNDGTIANDGNITGTTVNNGALTNDGNVEGEVVNNNTINNNLSIDGDITNNGNGEITNSAGGSITGGMDNKGVIDNAGSIISTNGKSIENSGTINNTGDLNGKINNASDGIINTTINGMNGDITNNGNIHYTNGGSVENDISGDGIVHLDGNGTAILNANLGGNTLSLNSGTLIFGSNKDISQGGFIGNGGAIGNILDGKTLTYKLGNANLVKDTKVDGIDFDLNNLTSDKFIANFTGNGKLNIDKVQVKGNTLKDSIRVYLGDTTKVDKNHLNVKNQKLPTIMTPIRRLAGRVEDNYLTYAGTGNSAKDFNPAILASPVATLIGGQITQSQTLQDSFFHMNRYMKYSSNARIASEDRNKYALSELHPYPTYVRSSLPETSQAMWVKPYTTFEKVHLKGGLGVSNTAYGALYGGDTELTNLGHGYKGVISAFVGYNGAHQSYNGISMNQQGGTLGVTGTLYHGNFYTGLTLSAGASAGEAHTPFGTDHFTMLTAGIANKTGYNIELADGKFIIQPSLYLGYTFVNNFDYKNSAGINIDSDPLSTIQIAPGIKFIGNLKNGWQPYAGVDMMWNIMGRTKFKAADSRLPELSVKPYVQYGVGLQKSWSDRFTAFFQTMLRNGGRTGIVLEGGFRWTFGKDTKEVVKTNSEKNVKVIKNYTPSAVETNVKGNTMTIIKPPSPTFAPIKTKVNSFTSRMDGSNDVVKYQNGNKKVLKRYYDISKDKRVRIVVTTDI